MAYIGSDIEDALELPAGSVLTFESQSKPTGLNDSLDLDRTETDDPRVASTEESGSVVILPSTTPGKIAFSYGEELVFSRIWIAPQVIDPPFIAEDLTYTVYTWNAWITKPVDWTAESITGETDGVEYQIDAFDITIPAFWEVSYDMVLYLEGPAVQETTYTETIDGDDYDIEISSIRVIGFDPEPNWLSKVRLSYEFETAMFANERLKEQRRPLRTLVRRSLRASYHTRDLEALKFRTYLMYGHDKTFACPIYPERLDVTTCTQDTTAIVLSSSTTDKWNLNNQCERVILVDHDNGQNEIKTISSIAANEITTTYPIQLAFTPASTVCYPIFIGTLKSLQEKHHTDRITETTLDFEEYFSG